MKRMHCSSKRLIRMTTRISNHLMHVQPSDIMKTLYMACTYVPKKKPFQTQNKCKYHLIQYCIQVIEINTVLN